MLRYLPPKSQVWGHRVNRLSSAQLLERANRLISELAIVDNEQLSELSIAWAVDKCVIAADAFEGLNALLGPGTTRDHHMGLGRGTFRQMRWNVTSNHLGAVAAWLDHLCVEVSDDKFSAMCNYHRTFRWKTEPVNEQDQCGGILGVCFGSQRLITTMFSFRTMERYQNVKAFLAEIDLVKLSDKHLHSPAARGRKKTTP